jgi:inhibitor of KinA sporulation pathway (predicted exonuclease)
MIKFEFNMLVLNSSFSEEDVKQINAYADYVRSQERDRLSQTLKDYFELTRYSVDVEGAEENVQWDAGFQSALALIKKEN